MYWANVTQNYHALPNKTVSSANILNILSVLNRRNQINNSDTADTNLAPLNRSLSGLAMFTIWSIKVNTTSNNEHHSNIFHGSCQNDDRCLCNLSASPS